MSEQEKGAAPGAEAPAAIEETCAEQTPGERIVGELGRLAGLRDRGQLAETALREATEATGGLVAFSSDGNGGFVLDFGMMPDPPRPKRPSRD